MLRLIEERTEEGEIFAPNPYGSFFEMSVDEGDIKIMSSRVGKEWSAAGNGSLVRLWFEVLDEGVDEAMEVGDGVLLNPVYSPARVTWSTTLTDLLLPMRPALDENYPNPFNPSTTIPFATPALQLVQLEIYNVLGQKVRTLMAGPVEPGFHTIVWSGRNDAGKAVAAGFYFSLLQTAGHTQARKMLLLK